MNLVELTKMYDFAGRTVVVTGGTGVLGQAMVRAIVGCGANVALVARNPEKAEPQIAALEGPGRAVAFTADVLDAGSLREAEQEIVRQFGRVDALLNGAGGNHPGATTSRTRSTTRVCASSSTSATRSRPRWATATSDSSKRPKRSSAAT